MFVVVAAATLLVSCSSKSSIVGKWQEIGSDDRTMEFFKDGTISDISGDGMSLGGKYSFVDDDRIKVELDGIAALRGSMIFRVSISGGELSLTDPEGKILKYRSAK